MGHIVKTSAGTFRANWRDPTGKQKAKTFRTRKEASAFLADVEGSLNRGGYVDPHAGRLRLGTLAQRWYASRSVEARTAERTLSLLRTHVLPQWGDWPLSKIEYLGVQEWVTELGQRLAPATAAKCYHLLRTILAVAVQSRILAVNPADGVKLPRDRSGDVRTPVLDRATFVGNLLPAVPVRHRALVCCAAGAGLRWGECAGLAWDAVDLDAGQLHVAQVAVETHGGVTIRPYPKSRAGVRTVPMPGFLVDALRAHRPAESPEPRSLVFVDRAGRPLRRSNFRRRVWRPSLVRAGLLGGVEETGPHRFRASWRDAEGFEWSAEFTTEREAVAQVAARSSGGLRFHDLRHSYATWLVTEGVPVNVVQRVMGHEQASTTLNRYTHTPGDYAARVLRAFDPSADDLLTFPPETPDPDDDEPEEET